MEQKTIPVELKTADDGTFEGYASAYEVVDSYGDVVKRGAFAKTIAERGSKIKLLWNHDSSAPPIGKFLSLEEDSYGLKVKGRLSNTPRGQEVLQLLREGSIDSMSIGYTTIKYDYEQRDDLGREVRNLREVRLYEVSAVNFPANEAATITQVKRQSELETILVQAEAYILSELKAGRTLSAASLTRIKAALDSISSATDELTALLEAAEPSGKSHITPGAPAAANPSTEPPPALGLLEGLKALRQDARRDAVLLELRQFGRTFTHGRNPHGT